jgi:Fe-S-cluster containining protein
MRRALVPRESKGPFDGKATRFATSLALPVDKNRTGECNRCGACCMFLVRCPFLKFEDGKPNSASCRAYLIRPPQCRKYPRTKGEQIHQPCGYIFRDSTP